MPVNRREFLSAVAASGLSMSLGRRAIAFSRPAASDLSPGSEKEAARLTQSCLDYFWDKDSHMFRAPVLSAETVSSDAAHDRGYTFWPSLVALHALVEGEKAHPGKYTAQIAMVYEGLEAYFSTDLGAYSSWLHFPGNIDAYYDDNSWAVIVLVEASLACRASDPVGSARYLKRATDVMADFVIKGHDTSDKPGGMRWGLDATKPNTSDRGTSSTAGSALAALMLARAGVNAKFYTVWGHDLLNWLKANLLDKDDLIMDALTEPDWKARHIKWTYNTGVPMRAYVEHYRLTKSADSLKMATQLARAAMDIDGALFDQKIHDPAKRHFWDGTYFVHYLIDGLLQVAQVNGPSKIRKELKAAALRTTRYTQAYLRDDEDGLYWRNMRLYAIGPQQHEILKLWTRQEIPPEFDASERSQEAKFQNLSVGERLWLKLCSPTREPRACSG